MGCQAGAVEGMKAEAIYLEKKSKLQSNEKSTRIAKIRCPAYPNSPKWFRRHCQVSTFFWHDQAQARFVLQIQGVSIYSFLPAPLQGPKIEQ